MILIIMRDIKREVMFKCHFCNKMFISYKHYCIHVKLKHTITNKREGQGYHEII